MKHLVSTHKTRPDPDQSLTHAALYMAIEHRCPGRGLVHHSDQGSQYSAKDYRDRLDVLGITASMSSKGNPKDNAVVESFFCSLKNELTHHRCFVNQDQARSEIFDYIEIFYNCKRAHATTAKEPTRPCITQARSPTKK